MSQQKARHLTEPQRDVHRKGLWIRQIRRPLTALAGLVVAMSLVGTSYQSRLLARYPPVGQMVDVGGYRLHLSCQGSGQPVVILESGMGGPGLSWAHIQPEIAKTTQVCVYDRAGLGWSEPGQLPRTAAIMAEELHTLMGKAAVPGPYVLVGYSSGGLVTRLFAYRYPQEVSGMVLVDATHGDQVERLDVNPWLLPLLPRLFSVLPLLARSGIPALAPELIPLPGKQQLPAEAYAAYQALMVADPDFMTAVYGEFSAVAQNLAQARHADGANSLGDMPLVVIAASRSRTGDGSDLSAAQQAYDNTWRQLQAELTALSSNGRLTVASGSGHDLPFQQPGLIVDAVREVAAAARVP